jgi:hypothetical protein
MLRDDPDRLPGAETVRREKSSAELKSIVVLQTVFFVEITPVSGLVAQKKVRRENVCGPKDGKRRRCRNHTAKWEVHCHGTQWVQV